jgi:hypothetical protein
MNNNTFPGYNPSFKINETTNKELLIRLKKEATKSNTKIINNHHTVIDSLVSITMTIAAMGTAEGIVTDLSKQFNIMVTMRYNFLDTVSESNYNNAEYIIYLCNTIYNKLDNQDFAVAEPKGYKYRMFF